MYKRIFCLIVIILMTTSTSNAYYIKAIRGTGGHLYMARGFVDEEETSGIFLIVHSQLANGTKAHDWEVSFTVVPDDADITYLVVSVDGHLLLDPTEDEDNIVTGEDAEGVGTQNFGPYLVWASADPEYGDLIWTIDIYSRNGRDYYVGIVMQWGYGVNPPPAIQGAYSLEDELSISSNTIPLLALVMTAISIALMGQLAYKRAYKREVSKTEVFVK